MPHSHWLFCAVFAAALVACGQGAIILGVGGDNSNASAGTFFEGAMTAGFPEAASDDAVQANIVAVGYGH